MVKEDPKNMDYKEGITIIIPSYKGKNHILSLLNSLKNQTLNKSLFENIIIINGEKDRTKEIIDDFIKENNQLNIKIIYEKEANASKARNIGLDNVSRKYVTFIDDDDYISPNYLEKLYENRKEDTIVIGGFLDVNPDTEEVFNSYITSEIDSNSEYIKNPYKKLKSVLTINVSKLIPSKSLEEVRFKPHIKSGDDISFNCLNYAKNDYKFYVIPKEEKAIYYRVLKENSLSRQKTSYDFNIKERLIVIKDLNNLLESLNNEEVNEFIKSRINAQTIFIREYLEKFPEDTGKVREEIDKKNLIYFPYKIINKNQAKTLVISYNFPPYLDTSGIVMAKRIATKKEIVDVVHNKMDVKKDKKLKLIATPYIDHDILINSPYAFKAWEKIKKFIKKGINEINKIVGKKGEYVKVYSRSMHPASHFLAFEYKIKYPNVKWTAEFSDPIRYKSDGKERIHLIKDEKYVDRIYNLTKEYNIDKKEYNNLFFLCESLAFIFADEIVFTNENQEKFMIEAYPSENIREKVRKIAKIDKHPTLEKKYYNLIESHYKIDNDYVNIGYFGAFYENRTLDDVFFSAYNLNSELKKKLKIHIFTSANDSIYNLIDCIPIRKIIKLNHYLPYLEFLNLIEKFDCLIVKDAKIKGMNPYLPSKISDYLGSNSDTWIIYEKNSPISKYKVKYKSPLNDVLKIITTLEKIVKDKINEKFLD